MKIYIAEDEPLAAAKLKLFLERLGEGGDIAHFDNGMSIAAALQDEVPDILFLDIHMPELNGMEVLDRLTRQCGKDKLPQIIITSAYDQYALQSFGYNVTDYLLKPYTLDRLQQAVAKAKEAIRLHRLDHEVNASTLTIRNEGMTETIATADIRYLESLKDYVRIVCRNGKKPMVLGTLSSFEQQLPPDSFVRLHRSYIVNKTDIQAIGTQSVVMSDGTQIAIGKTYRKVLQGNSD